MGYLGSIDRDEVFDLSPREIRVLAHQVVERLDGDELARGDVQGRPDGAVGAAAEPVAKQVPLHAARGAQEVRLVLAEAVEPVALPLDLELVVSVAAEGDVGVDAAGDQDGAGLSVEGDDLAPLAGGVGGCVPAARVVGQEDGAVVVVGEGALVARDVGTPRVGQVDVRAAAAEGELLLLLEAEADAPAPVPERQLVPGVPGVLRRAPGVAVQRHQDERRLQRLLLHRRRRRHQRLVCERHDRLVGVGILRTGLCLWWIRADGEEQAEPGRFRGLMRSALQVGQERTGSGGCRSRQLRS
ncbi:hypothetical protein VTK73DRAFT_2130 [Phialemonium thermophilum]|uniref:Uncharacterized protein n=1 Tax=Phialemonium thermophilum TaxID=223376 RepID=A0ABR3VSK3_9PEZI